VEFQAGPVGDPQLLKQQDYSQNPFLDGFVPFSYSENEAYNVYQRLNNSAQIYASNASAGRAPLYDWKGLNSNGWITGLGVSSGISPFTLAADINYLGFASLFEGPGHQRIPYQYENFGPLLPLFATD
jgi:hypothetical protein